MSINKKLHPISRDVISYNYIFIVDTKKSPPMWGLMVAAHGFEPRTHRVWTDCSSQLSYAAMYGASDRDWTGDLILTKDTLCRLSYTSTMNDHFTVNFCGCGDRTWTCDLRVMSPTSYQLLHPAINGGGRRIRTFEVEDGRFTVCSLWPLGNPSINKMELAIGIEPTTCWLQVSCSTNWATPAFHKRYLIILSPKPSITFLCKQITP